VLLATPVYRGSLTGTLKNLLDHVPVGALQGKPVGIVAMGATDHHFLGAERHLRDVAAAPAPLAARPPRP
jgi:FMN reductase